MLHATRRIKKGEEITTSYIALENDYYRRAEQIKAFWGFKCDCPLCIADSRTPEALRTKRAELQLGLQNKQGYGHSNVASLRLFQTTINEIAATYDAELYSGLPKVALLDWLPVSALAYHRHYDASKCSSQFVEFLYALGFSVDTEDSLILKITPTANSMLPNFDENVTDLLLEQIALAHDVGRADVADHLLGFARSVERASHGADQKILQGYREKMRSRRLKGFVAQKLAARMNNLGL